MRAKNIPEVSGRIVDFLSDNSASPFVIINNEGDILRASKKFKTFLSFKKKGKTYNIFSLISDELSKKKLLSFLKNQNKSRIQSKLNFINNKRFSVDIKKIDSGEELFYIELKIKDGKDKILEEKDALYLISEAANTAQDMDELFALVHKSVNKLLPAKNFYVAFIHKNWEIEFPYFVDEKETNSKPVKISPKRYNKSLTEYLVRSGEPLIINKKRFHELESRGEVKLYGGDSVEWIGVPLRDSSGKIFGAMAAQTYNSSLAYTRLDIKTLSFISSQLAMAIERRHAYSKLIQSENIFQALINSAEVAFFIIKDDKFSFVNKTAEKITGYSSYEFSRIYFWNIVHEDMAEMVKNRELSRLSGKKVPSRYELKIKNKRGEQVWIDYSGSLINYEDGWAILGSALEITERKKNEEILRLANLVIENSKTIIIVWDTKPGWGIEYISENICEFGYSAKEILSNEVSFDEIIHPDDINRVCSEIKDFHFRKTEKFFQEYRIICKYGDIRWVYDRTTVARYENENDFRYQSVIIDVTDKIFAESAIKQSENKYRTLFENSLEGLFLIKDKKYVDCNVRAIQYFGCNKREIIGKSPIDFSPQYQPSGESSEDLIHEKLNAVINGTPQFFYWLHKRKNGKMLDAEVLLNAMEINKEKIVLVNLRDISERKNAERKLLEAKEKAELSDKLKTDFLLQMSHEIRTPLNSMISFSSLIESEMRGNIGGELQIAFQAINTAGKRIVKTIDQILEMSSIQKGMYERELKKIDLYNDVLLEIINKNKKAAEEKGLSLELINEVEDTLIYADKRALLKIIGNILDNAIKFTEKGAVQVILRTYENKLNVLIKDTGVGMNKDFIEDVFKPFMQEEQGVMRSYEGSGLGLAIAKKYCELNNIDILIQSEKGKGTRIKLILNQ